MKPIQKRLPPTLFILGLAAIAVSILLDLSLIGTLMSGCEGETFERTGAQLQMLAIEKAARVENLARRMNFAASLMRRDIGWPTRQEILR